MQRVSDNNFEWDSTALNHILCIHGKKRRPDVYSTRLFCLWLHMFFIKVSRSSKMTPHGSDWERTQRQAHGWALAALLTIAFRSPMELEYDKQRRALAAPMPHRSGVSSVRQAIAIIIFQARWRCSSALCLVGNQSFYIRWWLGFSLSESAFFHIHFCFQGSCEQWVGSVLGFMQPRIPSETDGKLVHDLSVTSERL